MNLVIKDKYIKINIFRLFFLTFIRKRQKFIFVIYIYILRKFLTIFFFFNMVKIIEVLFKINLSNSTINYLPANMTFFVFQ
jgi:hypothetical protein